MVSLFKFEEQLSSPSLAKGKNYFEDGYVIEIEEIDKGVWVAQVEGTEIYDVDINIKKDNTIKDCFCDCPHDEEFCKHVIAVLHCIRNKKTVIVESTKTKNLSFAQLFKKVDEKELAEFVKQYAAKNKDFKFAFEIAFATKDENYDVVKTYEDILTKIVKKHTQRGFIHYQNAKPLAKELNKILNDIKAIFIDGNLIDAFKINRLIMHELIYAVPNADDSSGSLGDLIFECLDFLTHIFDKAPIDLKEKIFEFIHKELSNKIYFDYGDFGNHLFRLFFDGAISLSKSDEFLTFVDAKISSFNGKRDDYEKTYFQKSKIEFLNQIGNTAEAEKLTLQNLDIVELRQAEVEKLIASKSYKDAKLLISEGIKIAEEKRHTGTVNSWHQQFLRIAVLENEITTIRKFTKIFAFDSGFHKQYYQQWKNTFNAEEWILIIEEHISKTIISLEKNNKKYFNLFDQNSSFLYALAPIYVAEGLFDRLWLQIKKGFTLDILISFHKNMFPLYADELIELYARALDKEAEIASNRSDYCTLVNKMKNIAKSNETYKAVITKKAITFRELYKKRPAMLEELAGI